MGGAVVTLWNFLAMSLALLGVIYFVAHKADPGAFTGFFLMFLVLFFCAGIGNGATFRMIPIIFPYPETKGNKRGEGKVPPLE